MSHIKIFFKQICSEFVTEFVDGDDRGNEPYEFERRHSGMNISPDESFLQTTFTRRQGN